MRSSWLILACSCSLRLVGAQEQQLSFGISTGAELSHPKPASASLGDSLVRPPHSPPLETSLDVPSPVPRALTDLLRPIKSQQSSTDSSPPACEAVLTTARTLLHTLNTRSSLSKSPTTFTPTRSSSASILDGLESSLGPFGAGIVRVGRKGVGYLYGGSKEGADPTRRDWSVRGAVKALGRLVELQNQGSGTGGGDGRKGGKKLGEREVREGMLRVVRLATEAASAGCHDGWTLLGDLFLTGHLTLEPELQLALASYSRASEDGGIPDAQYKLGFLYGSNYGRAMGGVEGAGAQGSALLHYTFAALSSHVPASMTVGYRHWVGIGTKQSCEEALGWYKAAADDAMRTFNAGPPGGRLLPPPKLRMSDLKGGAYGPGASSSNRPQVTGGSSSQTQQEWDDLLEYHHFHAERGDPTYMFRLGRLYYQGFGGGGLGGDRGAKARLDVGMEPFVDGLSEGGRDFVRSSQWFMRVARSVWQKDGREAMFNPAASKGAGKKAHYDVAKDPRTKMDDHFTMVAGLAAGFLARMYMRGEGVRVDYDKAFLWFMRGSGQGDRESNNGLGVLFRDGLGVDRDLKKANALFLAAAQHDLAEAQVNLGKYHFGIGDYTLATSYFELAIRQDPNRISDTFQSFYYLAELSSHTKNRPESCPSTVSFYKMVAERGDWNHEVWWEAERALKSGDERLALLGYWIMAERGYEAAQNNVAWILDRDKKRLRLPILDSDIASNETDRLALAYWTRSAAQDNVDALVKMGDYYYAGLGVDAEGSQIEEAAACYQSAANTRISAMAMWNLGWMHENGKGVAQDYHLAKRYYDMALETSADAYLPATLSLISLHVRSLYHTLFGSTEEQQKLSLFSNPPGVEKPPVVQTPWGVGRAWREIQRRWGYDPGPEPGVEGVEDGRRGDEVNGGERDVKASQRELEGNEEPREWRRHGENGRVGEEEEDEFFLEGEGDLTGTVAIVALCMLLAWLLYFRQGRLPIEPPHRRPNVAAPQPAPRPHAPPVVVVAPPPPAPEEPEVAEAVAASSEEDEDVDMGEGEGDA